MKYNNKQLIDIKRKNPWWRARSLIEEDEKIRELGTLKYQYNFPELELLNLKLSGIYTIRGPRQIGKSTAIKQIIKKLLIEAGVEPLSVFYLSCEGLRTDRDLYRFIDEYLDDAPASGILYLFLDEITFVDEWQRAIKELADDGRLSRAVVILTGSDMIDLKKNAELMPGRRGKSDVLDIYLLPLKFREFLSLVEPDILKLDLAGALKGISRFQVNFLHYLICGGIPLAINEYFTGMRMPTYIYELYRSWIVGDILKKGKSEAIFDSIVANLIRCFTTPISWYKLGKESHLMSHAAAMDYVELLERMFVLRKLECLDINSRQPILRKNKKIYFSDPLIFDALHARVDGFSEESFTHAKQWMDDTVNLSKKIEQVVVSGLCSVHDHVFYWAGKNGEVDAVVKHSGGRLSFHEVKYQRRVSTGEFSWFSKAFPKEQLTVYTKVDYENSENVTCVPVSLALAGVV